MSSRPLGGWHAPETLGRAPHSGVSLASEGELSRLPAAVVLAGLLEVYDQGTTQSCTAQALAAGIELLGPRSGYAPERPSREDLYWLERQAIGRVSSDSGAIIADGVAVLRQGWRRETSHALTFGPEWLRPPDALAPDAPRLVNAEALDFDPSTIAFELSCGHPVVAGFRVTRDWISPADPVLPEPQGEAIGGHAVLLVGYDREARLWRVRNSWGSGWADGGYCWLPWAWTSMPWCGELHSLRAIRRVR